MVLCLIDVYWQLIKMLLLTQKGSIIWVAKVFFALKEILSLRHKETEHAKRIRPLRSLREKKTTLATNTPLRTLREIKKVSRQDAKK